MRRPEEHPLEGNRFIDQAEPGQLAVAFELRRLSDAVQSQAHAQRQRNRLAAITAAHRGIELPTDLEELAAEGAWLPADLEKLGQHVSAWLHDQEDPL